MDIYIHIYTYIFRATTSCEKKKVYVYIKLLIKTQGFQIPSVFMRVSIYTWISCVYPIPHKNLGFPDSLSFYEGFYIHMNFMCISIYTYTYTQTFPKDPG